MSHKCHLQNWCFKKPHKVITTGIHMVKVYKSISSEVKLYVWRKKILIIVNCKQSIVSGQLSHTHSQTDAHIGTLWSVMCVVKLTQEVMQKHKGPLLLTNVFTMWAHIFLFFLAGSNGLKFKKLKPKSIFLHTPIILLH